MSDPSANPDDEFIRQMALTTNHYHPGMSSPDIADIAPPKPKRIRSRWRLFWFVILAVWLVGRLQEGLRDTGEHAAQSAGQTQIDSSAVIQTSAIAAPGIDPRRPSSMIDSSGVPYPADVRRPLPATADAMRFAASHAAPDVVASLRSEAETMIIHCTQGLYLQRLSCLNSRDQFVAEYEAAMLGNRTYAWDVGDMISMGTTAGVRPNPRMSCAWSLVNHAEGGWAAKASSSVYTALACSLHPAAIAEAHTIEHRIAALTSPSNK